ncbi:hypothetical protein Ais01nite_69360 [Asanoa ishikariensis]|uniref:BON domain-containing protein n=1 Tax=Asanoa ishikariensis TaxID=137265 RepID=A0A1H3N2B1_9ACTN|nr:hypothetical protein [Asanoa ishikariensis]GIF68901.1 hypothetical protein Ais01nite_69360 [Asanoa ishikariensis]SDY82976.1 hypothetical protein SAMN05421684_1769 [Asanoa ishikariensis]
MNDYTEAEVQRAMAEDLDIAEQGITVVRSDVGLVLRGEVESPHRRDEIVRMVHGRFPGIEIAADIGVTRAAAPTEAEELA